MPESNERPSYSVRLNARGTVAFSNTINLAHHARIQKVLLEEVQLRQRFFLV